MAERGKPLPMRLKIEIKQRTGGGERVKPLARELSVDPKTVRKYRGGKTA